jgi:hypothetical protein
MGLRPIPTPPVLDSRIRLAFLALVIVQAAHSIEEYIYHLFDVFGPARFVSGLFSDDLALGFAIANTIIVALGVLSYVAVRRDLPSARAVVWFWAVLELANGLGHIFLAVNRGGYFPGLATAPFLLLVLAYLIARLSTTRSALRS